MCEDSYSESSDSDDDWISPMTEFYTEERATPTMLFSYAKSNVVLDKILT